MATPVGATGSKVRIVRHPPRTQKSGKSLCPHCSVSELTISHQLTNAAGGNGVVAIPSYSFIHAHEISGERALLRDESISVPV